MALERNYRFVALNNTGQTLAANAFTVKARRWNYSSTGVQTWEASEASLYTGNASTVANGGYDTGMAAVNNSSDAYLGGAFKLSVTAPASSNGTVSIFLQRSTDAGSTFADNGTGTVVKVFSFTTSGTQVDIIPI